MKFEKLSAPSLKDLFVKQLQDQILSGEIPVGTILPSERELATQMQVSRAVVNSGLVQLNKMGFIEIIPRRGSQVIDYRKNGNINTLIAIMEFQGGVLGKEEVRSILDLRRGLERIAVRNAIAHASDEDIENLSGILAKMATSDTEKEASEHAFEFQHELAFIGGNSILPLIYYSFKTPVITLWERYCRLYGIHKLCVNTETMYKFVKNREKEKAYQWIDDYLDRVINGDEKIYF